MFGLKYFILAATSLAAESLAASATVPHLRTRSLDLSDIIKNTACAMMVEYDVNPNRIPHRIKTVKCEDQMNQWHSKNQQHDYCSHTIDNHVMECVEMTDRVLVFNKETKATETLDVPVGCTCMIGKSMHMLS